MSSLEKNSWSSIIASEFFLLSFLSNQANCIRRSTKHMQQNSENKL